MSKNTPAQESLQLATPDGGTTHVEKYEFEPIKGYPMLNWRGKRPFTSTQYYPAQLKERSGHPDGNGWTRSRRLTVSMTSSQGGSRMGCRLHCCVPRS